MSRATFIIMYAVALSIFVGMWQKDVFASLAMSAALLLYFEVKLT